MVSDKRRRELARAKWERQRARRAVAEARARKLRIIGGVVLSAAAVVLIGLGIYALVGNDSPTPTSPTFPTENTLTLKQPTTPTHPTKTSSSTSTTAPTPPHSAPPTRRTTPTAPITTATTGTGTP